MSDYPMLISNKLHSFRNFIAQIYSWENRRWWGDFFKCRTEIKSVRER